MDIILGIKVQDSTILATSKSFARGILVMQAEDIKTRLLGERLVMAFTGEAGDTVQFAEYIQANVLLYAMREGYELLPKATASFVRNQLATLLRLRKPYQVNVLLGGWDDKSDAPTLNWIDYLGTNVEMPYCAHGYAAFYTLSLLDRHYRPDMTTAEGLELLELCIKELEMRMPIDFKGVRVTTVSKDGVKVVRA